MMGDGMGQIHVETLLQMVKNWVIQANTELPEDVLFAFENALRNEKSPIGYCPKRSSQTFGNDQKALVRR